jgi:hypothetical protein
MEGITRFGDDVRTKIDDDFEAVFGAVARYGRKTWTDKERAAIQAQAHRNNPKHKAAVARRRKRKRGGPK